MKSKVILGVILLIILGIILYSSRINQTGKTKTLPVSNKIDVVATMNDEISSDTTWCGTFQLVWNDMVNEVVGQAVAFDEKLAIVDHLNQQDFNENSISEEYYYKIFGLKTLALKQEIEKGIKQKFNETSDILDDIDWSDDALDKGMSDYKRYLFYTMLKRDFKYEKEFDELENGTFANQYSNVKYFGINSDTDDKVRKQVDVLYYNSEEDFAVILNTVEGDEVILCRGENGLTFHEIYDDVMKKSEEYQGNKNFTDMDYLTVPEIAFNVKKEYQELENKKFKTSNGEIAEIAKAIQSIQMTMDKAGGSIKSEAAIDLKLQSAILIEDTPRYFDFTDEFTVFLKESRKDTPYFAAHISDITKFQ